MEENDEKIRIERILGVSVSQNTHFDSDSGLLAYPAGNSVVLLDVGSGTVVSHVVLETKKAISSLQLKGNSLLFVASQESNFLRIVNWESGIVRDLAPCQNVVCCAVSGNLGVVVTVSSDRVMSKGNREHQTIVSVWDYKTLINPTSNGNTPTQRANTPAGNNVNRGRKLASSSVASKVSSVAFSPDGLYFVTSGARHLKFWYIQLGKNECVLTGRPAILGSEHNQADFRDVVTDGSGTYAIANFDSTASSTLCQFDDRRFLDKWVQLKTKEAFCITIDEDLLFIGCADGIIRCFRAGKLDFITTLPLPHHLGVQIAGATNVTSLSAHPPLSRFPNVVAISATGGKKVAASYADSSLYVWDFQDIRRVGLTHSFLNHNGCIWDVDVGSIGGTANSWPSFVTCSNDDTIRLWDITSQTKTNLYSNECLDIKYISTRYLDSPLFISHGNGVRSVGIGTDFLCCGDRQGNLRLWGKNTKNEVIKVKAHKEEILSMDVKGNILATASRDGSINLYHISEEVDRIASLQEHSASVTGIRFFFSDRSPLLQLATCGADKMIILRQVVPKREYQDDLNFLSALAEGEFEEGLRVEVKLSIPSKTPLFDIEVDNSGRHVLVACQDSCVRVYNASTGKQSRSLRTAALEGQGPISTIIKLRLDPSGAYLAVSGTDKAITVFDYLKGEVMATLLGHSELATAITFTPDLQNLLSVGGDSCIFVWSLSREMIVTMKARMAEKRSRIPIQTAGSPSPPKQIFIPSSSSSPSPLLSSTSSSPQRGPDYRFSIGQLPDWAKKQITGDRSSSTKKTSVSLPQGKWSERVEQASATGPLTIKSFHHVDTVVPVSFPTKPTVQVHIRKEDEPFETCEESLREILMRTDEESSDFHSDLKSPTDGEEGLRGASETDESNKTTGSKASKSSALSYEINRNRNAELIMSVKVKRREESKTRLELEQRLDETRKKLKSIGYKSMSQSTADLSRSHYRVSQLLTIATLTKFLETHTGVSSNVCLPSPPTDWRKGKTIVRVSPTRIRVTTTENDEESTDAWDGSGEEPGLRRACSLQDLNQTTNLPHRRKRSFKRQRSRTRSTGGFDAQSLITRSTSMSALIMRKDNGSDSDESIPAKPSYMSKTISSQGKSKRKGQSQENLNRDDQPRLRVSSSEQNLANRSPRTRTASLSKAQPIHGLPKGLAIVTGVRQGSRDDETPLSIETATSSVDGLRKSLDQVLYLRRRVSTDNVRDREPLVRILDEGLLSAQRLLHHSVLYTEQSMPKILTEQDATDL